VRQGYFLFLCKLVNKYACACHLVLHSKGKGKELSIE